MKAIEIELPTSNEKVTLTGGTIEVLHEGGTIRVYVDSGERVIAYAAGRWVSYDLFDAEDEEETNG